jgi:D-inositol-3-phosphate glycosyltransferase
VARRGKRTRLLTVASLADQRQLDTMLRALTLLPQAELMVVGGPPRAELPDDPGYRRLTELAAGLGVRDRLVRTGQVNPARMPALLRSADLLLDLASHEAFSMVPEEAMACGIPVIAADDGPHSDAVVDGATGVLIPPERPALLARTIRKLLASPMLLEGFGIAAADRARARYGWERVGQETATVYAAATGLDQAAEPEDVLAAQVA